MIPPKGCQLKNEHYYQTVEFVKACCTQQPDGTWAWRNEPRTRDIEIAAQLPWPCPESALARIRNAHCGELKRFFTKRKSEPEPAPDPEIDLPELYSRLHTLIKAECDLFEQQERLKTDLHEVMAYLTRTDPEWRSFVATATQRD